MSDVLVHTEPTAGELGRVWRFLRATDGFGHIDRRLRRSERRWVEYLTDAHRRPVVFEVDGECCAVLWLDRYFPEFGTVCVHYGMGRRHLRGVLAAMELVLKDQLRAGVYSGIWAAVEGGDVRSGKLAARVGFRPLYVDEGCGDVLYLLDEAG